ncbi:MAG TPA: FtsX-like permease family protein, partial [Candidatus Synoicihabitans sp.]|nr:FtsX-like permease family protein [Candidatus Synoicihabitans sp.]
PRQRLVRQLLTESLLLSLGGGAIGLLVAVWINELLGHLLSLGDVRVVLSLDPAVIGFALAAALGTGLLFGVVPSWISSRADVNAALKQQTRGTIGARSQQRFRHALVVAEVMIVLVLLTGAGFFIRGLQRFATQDLGWQTNGLLSGTVTLPASRYETPEQRRTFIRALELQLAAMPGVDNYALCTAVPIAADRTANSTGPLYVEGRAVPPAGQAPVAGYTVVGSTYFATLQLPFVAGRDFPADLRPDAPRPVVINESMARHLWPGEDPIGKRFSVTADAPVWEEVIGVVRDAGFAAYAGLPETPLHFYRPLVQESWGYLTIVLRSSAPDSLAEPLRRLVARIDPDLSVNELGTVRQAVDERQRHLYVINDVLAAFSVLGLLLAAVGLYAVIAGFVAQRIPEFGVRLALGAAPQSILRLVIGKALSLVVLGLALGGAASLALVQLLSRLLPGFPGIDGLFSLLSVALLLAVALLACWIPARRATRVDPLTALRAE